MEQSQYLEGVNKTWKSIDHPTDLKHCKLAIFEEIGEIAGWYKKHVGYGRPKNEEWKTGIKGEFGDLLYYLTKFAELTDKLETLSRVAPFNVFDNVEDYVKKINEMYECATTIVTYSEHTDEFENALMDLSEKLFELIEHEEFSLEEIQICNLAKLQKRHGAKFNEAAAMESGRNRIEEDKAIQGL